VKKKILIFIITYKALHRLLDVYNSIPFKKLKKYKINVLISDDKSDDDTIKYARKIYSKNKNIKLNFNKKNHGYGGNIKICLNYALIKKFDYAVMIHGDNQYNPKYIPIMIKMFEKDKLIQAITGSRLLKSMKNVSKGGMPMYKLIGNIMLTKFQNLLLRTNFTDAHTGFWAYRIKNFKDKFYLLTTDGFNFDQQLRFQYIYKKQKISEIPIDTKYADERSQLHIIYAIRFFFETIVFFLMKVKIINFKTIKYLSK
tara:strand:- start:422 stop:1189 length:768 start_codon:yes stop_codon:yes gene_type:complete